MLAASTPQTTKFTVVAPFNVRDASEIERTVAAFARADEVIE
jgi:hypothetical protein